MSESCDLFKFWVMCYMLHVGAHFTCHHELWPISVSHSFSFLNSCFGLAGGIHYQKITIPVFRVLQNFAIPGYLPYILFSCYILSLLSSGWFVNLMSSLTFSLFFFIPVLFELIVACRLCVIYVREDTNSNV